VGSRQHGTK